MEPLDMISHFCAQFYAQLDNLRRQTDDLKKSKPHSILAQKEKELYDSTVVQPIEEEANRLRMLEVDGTFMWNILSVRQRLQSSDRLSKASLVELLEQIYQTFYLKLMELKFAYIPVPNDKYFESDELFGAQVYDKFLEARDEVKDSGNAFAAGLYTACVFHTARVLEHGLRAIAEKMNVQLTDKNQPIPLEFGDWNKVLDQIRNKIDAARKLPNNPAKADLITRYSEAMERLTWAKDQWRNDISHTRTRHTKDGAKDILDRTQELMKFLAGTLEMQW